MTHPMTQSPPTGELVAKLRAMNPWKDMDWPEVVKAAADRLEASTTLERELEAERADRQSDRFDAAAQFGTERARAIRAERALTVSQAEVERLKGLVETAFRDGLTYATNVIVTDADEAWRTSRVRAALQVEESKT